MGIAGGTKRAKCHSFPPCFEVELTTPESDTAGVQSDVPQNAVATATDQSAGEAAAWETRFRLLLDSARDYAIFGTDPHRCVDYWSVGAERLFQYSESQIRGVSADIIFTPEDRAHGAPVQEAAEVSRTDYSSGERWVMRFDGSRFYALVITWALRNEDGALLGFLKIVRDLTEPWLAEERLHTMQRALDASLRRRTAERDAAYEALHAANEELRVANEELRSSNDELRAEIEQRRQAEALRVEAVRRISSVQEEERRHISRELHDSVGQLLTALQLGLNRVAATEHGRHEEFKEVRALADTISLEMHALAVRLRPTALDDLGLAGAITSYVDFWSKRSGVPVDLDLSKFEGTRLEPDIELVLYRIIQEALTNVVKHAGATVVSVIVERRNTEVVVIIEDDGRGFDAESIAEHAANRLGFVGMNERAAQFGGKIEVESAPGEGTTVFVRIPLKA
jgi:PAS domain S-box-containing protein